MAAREKPLPLLRRLRRLTRDAPRLQVRRGAGVVERDGFENRCGLTSTQGSNPCLSATTYQ